MSDVEIHVRAAVEKRLATLEEFDKKRYMVVGDLAIKAVELIDPVVYESSSAVCGISTFDM